MADSASHRAGANRKAEIRVDNDLISVNGTFHTPHAADLLRDYPEEVWSQFIERWIDSGAEVDALVGSAGRRFIDVIRRPASAQVQGVNFEKELHPLLVAAVRGFPGASVTETGGTPGLIKDAKSGDLVIELRPPLLGGVVKIVVEAKDYQSEKAKKKAFTPKTIREQCDKATKNRGADTAIFVVDDPQLLPGGIAFGCVGEYYVWACTSETVSWAPLVIGAAATIAVSKKRPDLAPLRHALPLITSAVERNQAIRGLLKDATAHAADEETLLVRARQVLEEVLGYGTTG